MSSPSSSSSSSSSSSAADAEAENPRVVSVDALLQMCALRSVSRTVLAPVDRVKFIMQTQRELQRMDLLRGSFTSSWHCLRHLIKAEGLTSLWRGNWIQLLSLLPIALAQVFIAYPTTVFLFDNFPHHHTAAGYTAAHYTAHLGGAVAASFISYPLDYCRFRMAVDLRRSHGAPYHFRNALSFFSHRVLVECPHYFYTGLGLYVLGSLVYNSMHQALVSAVMPLVPRLFPQQPPPPSSSSAPGRGRRAAGEGGGDDYQEEEYLDYAAGRLSHSDTSSAGSNSGSSNSSGGGDGDDGGGWGEAAAQEPPSPVRTAVVQSALGFGVIVAAATAMYPVDLVRRRMMVAAMDDRFRYHDVAHCVRTIAREEGARGFFRGATMNIVRCGGVAALVLLNLPY